MKCACASVHVCMCACMYLCICVCACVHTCVQKNLVSQLPAASHLWLWREVGVGVLSPAVADEACQSLVPACLDTLQDVCQSPAPCVLQAATVVRFGCC